MRGLVLAIDAGTSGVRSMLFDLEGTIVSRSYQEFPSHYPSPSWVEQDAESWWSAVCQTTRDVLNSAGHLQRIIGVAVTNQRETIVPIDRSGKTIRRAIVWQDRRTVPQCDWIRQTVGPSEVYRITGLTVDPYFSAPKILWIKSNEPESFANAWKFMLVHDYIVYRLTGRAVTDYSNASRTMLFDLRRTDWSDTLLDALGIPREKLPDPVAPGTPVGQVHEQASHESGLPAGTEVIAGGGDQQCAALGVGVVRPGSIKATTGTGTFMLAYSDDVILDPRRRVLCSRHVVPHALVVEASMFTTGSALRWFRDNLGVHERLVATERGLDPYDVMVESASSVPAGSEGVMHLPHLVGAGAPYWNPRSRGAFVGLSLGHTRNHLIRSILEGVAYEIRTNLEVMRELGLNVSEMRVTGGAARSDLWMQIQADVLGVPVIRTQVEEATALGAAILVCHGTRLFSKLTDAVDSMVRVRDRLMPDPKNHDVYARGFETYRRLYEALSQVDLADN
ncbi:MAG: xylulokinase [Candidatus Thorarchaeota archaeon]